MTRENTIFEILMSRVATQSTGLPVVYPGLVYPDESRGETRAQDYILVSHTPNRPERGGINPEDRGSHKFRGFLTLSVMTRIGVGNSEAAELSGELISHFPADLRLSDGEVILRVVQEPYATQGYRDGDRWRTPVVVEYDTIAA